MKTVYLTDITGTIGEWLDIDFDSEVPNEVIELLKKAYEFSVNKMDNKDKVIIDKYNFMLKKRYGKNITVEIKSYIDDDKNIQYYYTSARYDNSDVYETIEEAYDKACIYLDGMGELW